MILPKKLACDSSRTSWMNLKKTNTGKMITVKAGFQKYDHGWVKKIISNAQNMPIDVDIEFAKKINFPSNRVNNNLIALVTDVLISNIKSLDLSGKLFSEPSTHSCRNPSCLGFIGLDLRNASSIVICEF
ncbi:MAG: hypothetical protein V4629_04980 [Pseudomonadota bacterium]